MSFLKRLGLKEGKEESAQAEESKETPEMRMARTATADLVAKATPALAKAEMLQDGAAYELEQMDKELRVYAEDDKVAFNALYPHFERLQNLKSAVDDVALHLRHVKTEAQWLHRMQNLTGEASEVFDLYNEIAEIFTRNFEGAPKVLETYRSKLEKVALNQRRTSTIFDEFHKTHEKYQRMQTPSNPKVEEAYQRYRKLLGLPPT